MKFKHNLNELSRFHPGGSTNFSPEDRALTQRFVDIFHPLEIKVLDHIVVGGTRYSSMAEQGEIPHQCVSKANYEVIALSESAVEENQDSCQYTHSF
jgi:DNA repair protein RadC